jgi:hypothetical protein
MWTWLPGDAVMLRSRTGFGLVLMVSEIDGPWIDPLTLPLARREDRNDEDVASWKHHSRIPNVLVVPVLVSATGLIGFLKGIET